MIKEWAKKYKVEILLFCLGFGVRFLYALFVQLKFGSTGFLAYSDAFAFYLRGAENLINHHTFSLGIAEPFFPDAYRPPLYTALVALFLYIKLPLVSVILFQNILGGAISILIYKIGRALAFSLHVSIFPAVLISIEPMSVYWNNLLMSDTLYTFLFLLSVYLFIKRRLFLFALIFGLATLTRTIGIYFFPLFLAFVLWRAKPVFPWKKVAISTLIFIAVLSPWMIRNKVAFDTWQLSSASWYNLYRNVMGQFASSKGFTLPIPPSLPLYDGADYGLAIYDFSYVPFYKENFRDIFLSQPANYIRFHASLVARSLFKNPYHYLSEYVVRPKFPSLFAGRRETAIALLVLFGGLFWYVAYILSLNWRSYNEGAACLLRRTFSDYVRYFRDAWSSRTWSRYE